MKRREFITVVGGTVIAWPLAARAQQPAKAARIGHLDLGPASARASRVEALRAALRDLGWVEGKNIVIEFRWADNVSQLPALAAEFAVVVPDQGERRTRRPRGLDAGAAGLDPRF